MSNENNGHDTEETPSVSYRRIWKPRNGAQGSMHLSLKAMSVLYDAGTPLSRDELADRLLLRLDAYERDYLEAWYTRRLHQVAAGKAKATGNEVKASTSFPTPILSVRRWLADVFTKRIYDGHSLIRDHDGKYRPGTTAPRVQTMTGELKPFTPDVRRELEQADHDAGRLHLVHLEFQRVAALGAFADPDVRAQIIVFLVNHFRSEKVPIDLRQIKREFAHLVRIADTPTIRAAVIRLAVDFLLDPLPDPLAGPRKPL